MRVFLLESGHSGAWLIRYSAIWSECVGPLTPQNLDATFHLHQASPMMLAGMVTTDAKKKRKKPMNVYGWDLTNICPVVPPLFIPSKGERVWVRFTLSDSTPSLASIAPRRRVHDVDPQAIQAAQTTRGSIASFFAPTRGPTMTQTVDPITMTPPSQPTSSSDPPTTPIDRPTLGGLPSPPSSTYHYTVTVSGPRHSQRARRSPDAFDVSVPDNHPSSVTSSTSLTFIAPGAPSPAATSDAHTAQASVASPLAVVPPPVTTVDNTPAAQPRTVPPAPATLLHPHDHFGTLLSNTIGSGNVTIDPATVDCVEDVFDFPADDFKVCRRLAGGEGVLHHLAHTMPTNQPTHQPTNHQPPTMVGQCPLNAP